MTVRGRHSVEEKEMRLADAADVVLEIESEVRGRRGKAQGYCLAFVDPNAARVPRSEEWPRRWRRSRAQSQVDKMLNLRDL